MPGSQLWSLLRKLERIQVSRNEISIPGGIGLARTDILRVYISSRMCSNSTYGVRDTFKGHHKLHATGTSSMLSLWPELHRQVWERLKVLERCIHLALSGLWMNVCFRLEV